jgi:hypothetical protein
MNLFHSSHSSNQIQKQNPPPFSQSTSTDPQSVFLRLLLENLVNITGNVPQLSQGGRLQFQSQKLKSNRTLTKCSFLVDILVNNARGRLHFQSPLSRYKSDLQLSTIKPWRACLSFPIDTSARFAHSKVSTADPQNLRFSLYTSTTEPSNIRKQRIWPLLSVLSTTRSE